MKKTILLVVSMALAAMMVGCQPQVEGDTSKADDKTTSANAPKPGDSQDKTEAPADDLKAAPPTGAAGEKK